MSRLFCEEASGEGLFVCRVHKDTPKRMFRLGASMDTYPTSARDLFQDG